MSDTQKQLYCHNCGWTGTVKDAAIGGEYLTHWYACPVCGAPVEPEGE